MQVATENQDSSAPAPHVSVLSNAPATASDAHYVNRDRSVFDVTIGDFLAALRRVQVPINKDGADVAFIAGNAQSARIVATSGVHLSSSAPLGFALSESFVVRGQHLLKTLATFSPAELVGGLGAKISSHDSMDRFFCIEATTPKSRYRGRFVMVPDALELNLEAIARENECRTGGSMVKVAADKLGVGVRRAVMCARNKTNSRDYANVFFEMTEGKLYVTGVSNSYASRVVVSDSIGEGVPEGVWAIHLTQAELAIQGISDQIAEKDALVDVAFNGSQMLLSTPLVTYALRCTGARIPNMSKIVAPFEPTWRLSLTKNSIAQVLHGLGIVIDDEAERQALRFGSDAEGVFMYPDGARAMDARVPLDGAQMLGQLPAGLALARGVLAAAISTDVADGALTFLGSDKQDVRHIHVHADGIEGLMVIMPTVL